MLHSKWNKATPSPPPFNTVSCLTANMYSVFLVLLQTTLEEGREKWSFNWWWSGKVQKIRIFIKWHLNRLCPSLGLFLPRLLHFNVHHSLFTQWKPTKSKKFHSNYFGKKNSREGKWDSSEACYNSVVFNILVMIIKKLIPYFSLSMHFCTSAIVTYQASIGHWYSTRSKIQNIISLFVISKKYIMV